MIIKELNEDGTSKAGSMEFLDQKSETQSQQGQSRPQSRQGQSRPHSQFGSQSHLGSQTHLGTQSQFGSQSHLGSQSQLNTSMGNSMGEITTETNFEKSTNKNVTNTEPESWKYLMECNYIYGSNTSVR